MVVVVEEVRETVEGVEEARVRRRRNEKIYRIGAIVVVISAN
jgi:hypothetical protein